MVRIGTEYMEGDWVGIWLERWQDIPTFGRERDGISDWDLKHERESEQSGDSVFTGLQTFLRFYFFVSVNAIFLNSLLARPSSFFFTTRE